MDRIRITDESGQHIYYDTEMSFQEQIVPPTNNNLYIEISNKAMGIPMYRQIMTIQARKDRKGVWSKRIYKAYTSSDQLIYFYHNDTVNCLKVCK